MLRTEVAVKSFKNYALLLLLFGIIGSQFANCGQGFRASPTSLALHLNETETGSSTETTNPKLAWALHASVCEKLRSCFAGVPKNCEQQVWLEPSLIESLNAPEGYNNYSEIYFAQENKILVADLVKRKICVSKMNALPCDDKYVMESYNSKSSRPFINVGSIIWGITECGEVISEP